MKKLMLLTVVVAFLGISLPQTVLADENPAVKTTTMDSQYSEIKLTELPAMITDAVKEKYPAYKVEKAFRGSDGTFKVTVSNAEGKLNLIYNEKGEFLKIVEK